MKPPLVGRQREVVALGAAATKGPGAVVVGPAGIGKTRLLTEVAAGSPRRSWWVAVTREAASIPYGPFVPLIEGLDEVLTAPGGTAAAFGVIRRTLESDDTPPLLVVDDAHLLDAASAAAVDMLARLAKIPVLVGIRAGAPVPQAVTALWKDGDLSRTHLGPLSRADSDDLARAMLGGPVEARSLGELWRMSQGHPMELRELILSGLEMGSFDDGGGMWTLTAPPSGSSRLVELVEERLGRLQPEERRAAETLAYAEALPLDLLLTVVDAVVVESLERADVVQVHREGGVAREVTLAHPLYGEVLRPGLPGSRRSLLARDLTTAAARLESQPDPLRVAAWRLEAGLADAEELASASRDAVARMAWEPALRFGRAALEIEESYLANTTVGAALAELGDAEGAEEHIRRAGALTEDPVLRAWADISLADVWFYHSGRMDDALELVRKHLAITADPEIAEDLRAALAVNLMMHGDLREVSDLATQVLDSESPSSRALLMALVASTLVAGQMLRPGDVHAGVEVALSLAEQHRVNFPNAEDLLHAGATIAHIGAGDVHAVRRLIDERRALAIDTDRADLPGFWGLLHGQLLLYEGHARASLDALREALLLLARFDSWLSSPLAHAEAAHSAGVLGDVTAAKRHLDAIPAGLRSTPRIRSRFGHASALVTALEQGVSAGAAEALASGDQAADDDHLLWAVEAWHLAVRLGTPEPAVSRLAAVAEDRPATIASLFHRHAVALHAGDTGDLSEVCRAFQQQGFALLAAETACQVADAHRAREEASLARRYAALALELLPEGSGARTPPFSSLPEGQPLTPREREVALLAASGITSKEIAERLFLSVRSVDNHLSRVYVKLGVSGRAELGEVLSPVDG